MGRLAIFIEKYTINRSPEFEALMRYRAAAEELGHHADYLFRRELRKIPKYDAVLIRALTDPLNSSFVAARIAELHGKPVIDDSRSILICCDKVHMYRRLTAAGVPFPRTVFCDATEIYPWRGEQLLAELGPRLVVKAPNSSFSQHVEMVTTADDFEKVGDRFLHRADRVVVQEFVQSEFDWRVGVLGGVAIRAVHRRRGRPGRRRLPRPPGPSRSGRLDEQPPGRAARPARGRCRATQRSSPGGGPRSR